MSGVDLPQDSFIVFPKEFMPMDQQMILEEIVLLFNRMVNEGEKL